MAQRVGGAVPLPQQQEMQLFNEPVRHTVMACTMCVLCGITAQLVLESMLDICSMHVGDLQADMGATRAMGLGLVKGSFLGFSGIKDRE